jgi:four helix bundle protein
MYHPDMSSPSAPHAPIHSFRDLIVWQKAIRLAAEVYAVTRALPTEERFGLSQQLRRAATSVAANIAEGHARQVRRDYVQFLAIARGSLAEVESHLEVARQSQLVTGDCIAEALRLSQEIGRMLTTLILKLSKAPPSKP